MGRGTSRSRSKDISKKADKDAGGVYYADATSAPSMDVKQGQLFFGCCCDMRRAVFIVNVMNICFALFGIAMYSVLSRDGFSENFDDDMTVYELDAISDYKGRAIAFGIVSVICSLIGIYGAVRYNSWMVIIAAVYYCISVTMKIVPFDLSGMLMAGVFAYPHFVFIKEVNNGIMTAENYPNEIHSCCCV
jgi:hypothetical protein